MLLHGWAWSLLTPDEVRREPGNMVTDSANRAGAGFVANTQKT